MILGWASFGHIGVLFPILVRAIGVIASIVSTYLVKAGDKGNVAEAMKSINFGFLVGSALSVIGFLVAGLLLPPLRRGPHQPRQADRDQGPAGVGELGSLGARHAARLQLPDRGRSCASRLNKVTEYFTGTEFSRSRDSSATARRGTPPTSSKASRSATSRASGRRSSSAPRSSAARWFYSGENALFVAYGVAMCGIGMLTLTGNTISMDVFGPVADNANGIGEMGYDREEMGEAKYQEGPPDPGGPRRRREHHQGGDQGVAIGSAVVSPPCRCSPSYITVDRLGGRGGERGDLRPGCSTTSRGLLTVSSPRVFIGMLLGGAGPPALQLDDDPGRRAGGVPDRERVPRPVPRQGDLGGDQEAGLRPRGQHLHDAPPRQELIGPAFLAVFTPVLVGFLLGPIALAGFLAGSIVVGQLMASFMCNAGGAWDNAKKMVEDEPRDARGEHRQGEREAQGVGHRRHGRRPAQGHRRARREPAAAR